MPLRRRWPRVEPVTAVFGLATVVLLVLAIADAVALRTNFTFLSGFAPDLFRRIWWELSRTHVLVLALSFVAAVATHLILRPSSKARQAHRLELIGPAIWALGAVMVAGRPGTPQSDDGWFNYAPNSGVVFSPGGGPDRELIGLVLACMGLAVTAIAIAWSFSRGSEDGSAG